MIDVTDYGAVGDNSTDDTIAIQKAIDDAMAVDGGGGGELVLFPPGRTYLCSAKLSLDMAKSVILCGTAAPEGIGLTSKTSTLNFVQGGSDPLISARASQGCTFENLRIMNQNADFVGYFLDLSGDGSDTSGSKVDRCHFQGSTKATGNAAGGILLGQAVSGIFSSNQFSFMKIGLMGVNKTGYSNSHLIIQNQFNNLIGPAAIVNAGQMWTIQSNTFEASQTSQACGYMDESGYGAYGPVMFLGNWFGDSQGQTGSTPWLQYSGNGLSCFGNYFKSSGPATPCILLSSDSQAMQGAAIVGNSFEGAFAVGVSGKGSVSGFSLIGNHATGGWISDPQNLLYNRVVLGNDTANNYFATPFQFANFANVGPLSAMPGATPFASMGTIQPGVPGFKNGELAFVGRGDGGGDDHGIVIAGGDFVNGPQIPLMRFQRNAGVQVFRPLVFEPTASVAKNSMFVDPNTGALCWIDKNGKTHILATP